MEFYGLAFYPHLKTNCFLMLWVLADASKKLIWRQGVNAPPIQTVPKTYESLSALYRKVTRKEKCVSPVGCSNGGKCVKGEAILSLIRSP